MLTFNLQMKIPPKDFRRKVEVHTWLSNIKLAFKVQWIYNNEGKWGVVQEHLDVVDHTWMGKTIYGVGKPYLGWEMDH